LARSDKTGTTPLTHPARAILTFVLLAGGCALWWTVGDHAGATPGRVLLLGVAAAIAVIPATRDLVERPLARVRNPSPRHRRWTMLAVFIASCFYILATALWTQHRELFPKLHDEHMHLLQIRMLAEGKLWSHAHPLADFFDTFYVMVRPVYAGVYFPGTTLMYVPSVWLGLDYWVLPLLVAGGCCAMLYRVTAELVDGEAGLLAALLLLSLKWFRHLALLVMSHTVLMLLGLGIIWAWLHWRRVRGAAADSAESRPRAGGDLGWAAIIGALGGWAAITRPLDALVYSIPVGVAMLARMYRDRVPPRRVAATLGIIVAAAAPFLAVQVIKNFGTTGHPLRSPYTAYLHQVTPQMSYGFHTFDPAVRPQTNLQQAIDYYDEFIVPAAREHRPDRIITTWWHERLPLLARATLPNRLLLVLLPAALLALPRARAAIVLAILLPLWVVAYAGFTFLLDWYGVLAAPGVIACVVLATARAIPDAASAKWRAAVRTFLALAVIVLAVSALPEFDRRVVDGGFQSPVLTFVYEYMPREVTPPAVVLFRYRTGDMIHAEPVYNIDTVDPDDAPIIRAHDLGPERDRELFDYYAKHQPDRTIYLFDRGPQPLIRLGTAAELARRFPITRPATQPAP
jgi:hypothetical protein